MSSWIANNATRWILAKTASNENAVHTPIKPGENESGDVLATRNSGLQSQEKPTMKH